MSARRPGSRGRRGPRIGVASIVQETNTWSPVPCTLKDFEVHGLVVGEAVRDQFAGTNTELGGALKAIDEGGAVAVPLVRAWANSSGRLTEAALTGLVEVLVQQIDGTNLDGLVLSLHGAMAAAGTDDADAALAIAARRALGPDVPIAVCLDLHANITEALIEVSDLVTGFHTYPHVDQAETGARAAALLLDRIAGRTAPVTVVAKRPMIVPAETMSTSDGPLAELRREADARTTGSVLDICIFPVQPWLDVDELGLAVTVTTDGDPALGRAVAEELADQAWRDRQRFAVELLSPEAAIAAARRSSVRPFIISESADAPTAGAAGDSPAMVRALLERGADLEAYVAVTDPAAVERCFAAGAGASVELALGAGVDGRFHQPVEMRGVVERTGDRPVVLTGPSYTGTEVSIGRFAVVRAGRLAVIVSERPPYTLDSALFSHAGLDPLAADILVVRSATGFRVGYPKPSTDAAVFLDLPGASTPRLDLLDFSRAPRPLYPLDDGVERPSAPVAQPAERSAAAAGAPSAGILARLRTLDARNEVLALLMLVAAIQLLPRAVPVGIYGIGVVEGARLALQGIALVLIFRSNRIINFAQAAFAFSAAMLFSALIQHRTLLRAVDPVCGGDCSGNALAVHATYWTSLLLTMAVTVLLGWVAYVVVIRRFAAAPRLLLTVATIFVGVAVGGVMDRIVAIVTPSGAADAGELAVGTRPATLPFSMSWRLGDVTFSAADFVTVGVLLLCALSLSMYLRRSAAGTAIRAASESPDRAATLGIDVNALTARVWMMAAGLAGAAGVLGAMAEGAAATSGRAGSEIVILAVAIVARMVSLPLAVAAALTIGVLQQALQWNDRIALFDASLFVLIVVLLLLQSGRLSRAQQALAGEWRSAREIRPIPRELRNLPAVRTLLRTSGAAGAVVLLGYPWFFEPSRTSTASVIMLYAIIGLSLLVLTGWAGQISLGQVAFSGVGAYVAAVTGLPFLLALLAGTVAGGIAALLVGLPALRLRGLHLAVLTLAFHQAVVVLMLTPDRYLGQRLPDVLERPALLGMELDDQRTFYYVTLVATLATGMAVLGMRRSRTARALLATRDNEQAAQAFGINLTRARVGAFAISGALSAFAGVLLAYQQGGLQSGSFGVGLSRTVFLYTVIGGLGSIAGPLIGFGYYALPVLMQLPGVVPLLLSGPVGLALLLLTPGGIGQLVFDARDSWLRKLARRERIVVPSLVADVAAGDDEPMPLAPKARTGVGTAYVPTRYHLPNQWLLDGVEATRNDRAEPVTAGTARDGGDRAG